MAKTQNTFNKRKREMEKKQKAQEKRERKEQRKTDQPGPTVVFPDQRDWE